MTQREVTQEQAQIRREEWLIKYGWFQNRELDWIDPRTGIRYKSAQIAEQVEKQRQRRLGKPA